MYDFATTDAPFVQVEVPTGEITFADPDDLAQFERAWQRMAAAALDPQRSAKFIRNMLRSTTTSPRKGSR
jgi:hypothetical protein